MKKINFYSIFAMAVLALSACGNQGQQPVAHGPVPFPVQKVENADVTIYREYAANIEGEQNIEIRPKVDGFIEKIYIDEGATVKKGQLLFQLSAETLNQRVNAAQANIEVAKAQVAKAQVEVNKIKPLVEKNIVSSIQMETAESNLKAANAQLNAARADYLNARENLSYTRITSPVDGIVGSLPYKVGSLVGRNEPKPLTTVSNISNVYAYFSLNEKQQLEFNRRFGQNTTKEQIKEMPDVELVLADGSLYQSKGRIEAINGMVNPRTGSISYRAKFPNPNNLLRNGNSGRVKLPAVIQSAMLVPQKSTFELQGKRFVYVVGQENKVQSREVVISEAVGQNYIVKGGVEEGQLIVNDGLIKLREGMQIVPQDMAAPMGGRDKGALSDK